MALPAVLHGFSSLLCRLTLAGVALIAPMSLYAAAWDCLVQPMQTVELSSPVVGLLDRVHVQRGDAVSRGQVLATLESRAERASTELARVKSEALGPTKTAQSKMEFSQRKAQRRQDMAAQKLMSAQDREDAEAEHELAKAELLTSQENKRIAKLEHEQQSSLLNLRSLRSPFDGVVVDQLLYPGEVVEPTGNKKAILRLAQLNPLKVQVILPLAQFGKISPGMTAAVVPEVPTGATYRAKVKTIDKLVDAASGTFIVFLEMPNPKLDAPAGVKCKVDFSATPSK